jgi:hypothetical protein
MNTISSAPNSRLVVCYSSLNIFLLVVYLIRFFYFILFVLHPLFMGDRLVITLGRVGERERKKKRWREREREREAEELSIKILLEKVAFCS